MKQQISAFFLVLMISAPVWADNHSESLNLRYEPSFWGTKFFNGEKKLRTPALKQHLSSNPEALAAFNKSKGARTLATIMAYVGGWGIGWAAGTAVNGDDGMDNTALAVGVVGIGIGIAATRRADSHVARGVDIFNSSTTSFKLNPSSIPQQTTKVTFKPAGFGVTWTF